MKTIAVLGCALVLLTVGCAATTDGEDASEPTDSTEDGLTSDPAKDKRCFADLFLGTTRLNQSVEGSLGARAFCKETAARTIAKGADYYYGASVSCSLAAPPSAARAEAFTSSMEAKGFFGWTLASKDGVLHGRAVSRRRTS